MLQGPHSNLKKQHQAAPQDAVTDTNGEMRDQVARTYRLQTELTHKTSHPFPAILPPPIHDVLPATYHITSCSLLIHL